MSTRELKEKYLRFFEERGHKRLPNAPLIPENDPTALFINSGMHPLVPYLLGEPHPLGDKLVSAQRCLRTGDIEEVGDATHHTFFEMLGNWSLNSYWKQEAISWSWQFLTQELGLDPKRLAVTCFAGDQDAPKDEEAAKIWREVGIPQERIFFLGKEDNWWTVGEAGPCGPDTEMFYDTTQKACGPDCRPGDGCGRFVEVWNDVFMEFNRLPGGRLEKLQQRNIDTGMGVERTVSVLQGHSDDYRTEVLRPLIQQVEKLSGRQYQDEDQAAMRVVADHLRAAAFLITEGIEPSGKERGYILRRLIRRAAVKMHQLKGGATADFGLEKIAALVVNLYPGEYFIGQEDQSRVLIERVVTQEMEKFAICLGDGLKKLKGVPEDKLDTGLAFDLYQSCGFPLEVTEELFAQRGKKVDRQEFEQIYKQHQALSRTTAKRMFAGGLADDSQAVVKLHTATHLLHQALREVLGDHVQQAGSNITPERLRFDFTHPEKLSQEQLDQVEAIINEKIKADLPVKMEAMSLAEAKKKGALAFFKERYADQVNVYSMGDYSKEVCGGPHVQSTREIGGVKIIKDKPVGAGRRRLYLELAHGN